MTNFFETRVENLEPKEEKKSSAAAKKSKENSYLEKRKKDDSGSSDVESSKDSSVEHILHGKFSRTTDYCKERAIIKKYSQKYFKLYR